MTVRAPRPGHRSWTTAALESMVSLAIVAGCSGGPAASPSMGASTGSSGGAGTGQSGGAGTGSSGGGGSLYPPPPGSGLSGVAASAAMPASGLIGGATFPPSAYYPPTGQDCQTTLDPSGVIPATPPQAYIDECSGCHGPNATGHSVYPPIPTTLTFEGFSAIVRAGLIGNNGLEMPFFKPTWLNDDDLRRIYGFVSKSPVIETGVCQAVPPMDAQDIASAIAAGTAVWRTPDGKTDPLGITTNVACVQCHAPDPLDIAYYGYGDSQILRRGIRHLPGAQIANVVDMVHALRAQYSIGRRDPMVARPFQPGGGVLPGETIQDRDAAFGAELVNMGLAFATKPIASTADAEAVIAEVWGINRHAMRIPIPFDRYTEDVFHNPDGYLSNCLPDIDGCDDHGSIADWLPVAPHVPQSTTGYYAAIDAYLASPTDATEAQVHSLAESATLVGTYPIGLDGLDTGKYLSLILANYCIRLELEGQPGCYEKGITPFPNNMEDMWNVGGTANFYGTGYEQYSSCDTEWTTCGQPGTPVWPAWILADITPGATLSSNFARLRHTWFTNWWTHFDPTLLVSGGPLTQRNEYFTRSLLWSNDDDWIFDGTNPASIRPTYSVFTAYEVMAHNVAKLESPQLWACSKWPAVEYTCTADDVRSGYFPIMINFAEQNDPQNPESENNVNYQVLFEPLDAARRPTFQMMVANIYRAFFWKLIGALQEDNWMCDPDSLQQLRIIRAQKFLSQAETQVSNAASDETMFETLATLMANSRASCPPLPANP